MSSTARISGIHPVRISGTHTMDNLGLQLAAGDSVDVLAGGIGQIVNRKLDVSITIDPQSAKEPKNAEGTKLVLDVLRKTDVWAYAKGL